MRVRVDRRGLAGPILGLVAILVICAFLYTLFDPAVTQIIQATSDQTANQQAQDAIDQREAIWNNILFVPLALGMLYIISRGILEQRRPG